MKKNIIFLTMLMTCSSCFASEEGIDAKGIETAQKNGHYIIRQTMTLPGGKNVVGKSTPAIISTKISNKLNSSIPPRTNTSGLSDDVSARYDQGSPWISSCGKIFSKEFVRTTCQTVLKLIRIGNTYKEQYIEEDVHSRMYEIALFNTYEKGKVISRNNHTRIGIALGEWEKQSATILQDEESSNYVFSIDLGCCQALVIAGLLYHFGIVHWILTATGFSASPFIVVPSMLAGAIVLPFPMTVGGTGLLLLTGYLYCITGGFKS